MVVATLGVCTHWVCVGGRKITSSPYKYPVSEAFVLSYKELHICCNDNVHATNMFKFNGYLHNRMCHSLEHSTLKNFNIQNGQAYHQVLHHFHK